MNSAMAYEPCQAPKTKFYQTECIKDSVGNTLLIGYDKEYRSQALMDDSGKITLDLANLKYDGIGLWQYGEGLIPVLKNGKVGYINTLGKLVIPAIYDDLQDPNDKYDETWANPASNDRIVVSKNGKFGVIDLQNKTILPFSNRYSEINAFAEGRATVRARNAYKWGVIDTSGKEIVKPQYDGLDGNLGGYYGYTQGLLGVKKGDKWGYITKSGKVAVPFSYDEIRPFSQQLAGVRKNDKWGFINGANKTIIPFKFSDKVVPRYSVNAFAAMYFIFDDGVAMVGSTNVEQTECINLSGNKVGCPKN